MSDPIPISLCFPCEHFRSTPGSSSETIWPSTAELFWKRFEETPPDRFAKTCGAQLDDSGCWTVKVLNENWSLDPQTRKITKTSGAIAVEWDRHVPFLLLVSMVCATPEPLEDEWTTPRDLYPGMDLFQGNLTLDTTKVAEHFAEDAEAFRTIAECLGGIPIEGADAGARFQVFAKCPIECRLWIADDEFPADFRLLFNRSTPAHFPGDALAVTANLLIGRLLENS